MKDKSERQAIATTAIVTYFSVQSFIIIFRKWGALSFADKVLAFETVLLSNLMFCEAMDVFFINNYDEYASRMFRGKLFGYPGVLYNKNTRYAFFRGEKLLTGNGKYEKNIDELRNRENSFRRNVEVTESSRNMSNKNPNFNNNTGIMTVKEKKNPFEIDSEPIKSLNTYKNISGNEFYSDTFEFYSNSGGQSGNETKSSKKQEIIEKNSKTASQYIRKVYTVIKLLVLSQTIAPLNSFFSYIFRGSEINDLKSSFMIYVPFTESSKAESIHQFIIVFATELIYLYSFLALSIDLYAVECLISANAKIEIDLFLISLKDFNDKFLKDKASALEPQQQIISTQFKRLLVHHQEIIRKIDTFNKLVSAACTYINGAICVELSVSIFLLQGDIFLKAKYSLIYVCLIMVLAQYSEEGQTIEDKLEDVRNCLYQISWHNFPNKLQRSFLILMTRTSKPTKVSGLHGIFVVNRMNVTMIVQASYSYFNLLKRTS